MLTTTKKGKIKLCTTCSPRKSRCGVLHDLPAIVNHNGDVIHAIKSWGHLISHPQKGDGPVPPKSKSQEKTGNKGKEKAQAAEDEVYSDDEGDAGDGDHQVNGDGARELVSEGEAGTVIHSFISQFEVTDSIVRLGLKPPVPPPPRWFQSQQ
jgi:hypothetical protein